MDIVPHHTIGLHCVIGEDVSIGAGCNIGNHVIIYTGSVIGNNVRIDDHAVIGKQPMRALNSAVSTDEQQPPCAIMDGCLIGTGAIIYANAKIGENCLVADLATIRENVTVGERTIVGRGVAIENQCKIGARCKLETNAYITAYSIIEDDCFIAPGVVTSNDNYAGRDLERYKHFKGVTVENGGRIGAQATLLPGVTVGRDGFVAAGAVVTKDVSGETIVAGNPARVLRSVDEKQLLKNQILKR